MAEADDDSGDGNQSATLLFNGASSRGSDSPLVQIAGLRLPLQPKLSQHSRPSPADWPNSSRREQSRKHESSAQFPPVPRRAASRFPTRLLLGGRRAAASSLRTSPPYTACRPPAKRRPPSPRSPSRRRLLVGLFLPGRCLPATLPGIPDHRCLPALSAVASPLPRPFCLVESGGGIRMRLLKAEELFRNVLKGGSKKQARLLGLDVGSKYVGLAVSDDQNRIAMPLSVLGRTKTNINLMADDFKTLEMHIFLLNNRKEGNAFSVALGKSGFQVAKYSLAGFVVGYPFNLQGQASPDAVQVRLLVGELYKTGKLDDLSYTYWDENFTSKCVEALLDPLKLHDPVETKTMTDKFAAVCILQGYLDNMNRELRSADNSEE